MFLHRSSLTLGMVVTAAACSLFLGTHAALAQFGFSNNSTSNTGFGDWNSPYAGALMQLPQVMGGNNLSPQFATVRPTWQLGAYVENMQTGVAIQQVMPGSAAQQVGLKSGDIVVAVAGYQVGYVNGKVYDVVEEIIKRANSNVVRILVLDSQSRQLRNLDMNVSQTQQSNATITGEVSIDRSVQVPSYSALKVEIQNASRPHMQIGGGSDYKQAFGMGPFRYNIAYDPQYIYPGDRYRLVASLFDSNQQVVGFAMQDIVAPNPSSQAVYNLRLQGPNSYNSNGQGNSSFAAYPPDMNTLNQVFQQFLGRNPTLGETQEWSRQLASGAKSIKDMKVELLSSPVFYDRAGNNPDLFIQLMIESVTGQQAQPAQIRSWRNRLDYYQGMRLAVAKELVHQYQ